MISANIHWKIINSKSSLFNGFLLPLTSEKINRHSCWTDLVPHEQNTGFGSVRTQAYIQAFIVVDPMMRPSRWKLFWRPLILIYKADRWSGYARSHLSLDFCFLLWSSSLQKKTGRANKTVFFTYPRIPPNSFIFGTSSIIRDVNLLHHWSYGCSAEVYFVSFWVNWDTWETSWVLW